MTITIKMKDARFVIGEQVNLVNHVMGYEIDMLEVTKVDESGVVARKLFSRKEFEFDTDGAASWSCNLSIQHRGDKNHEQPVLICCRS